MTRVKSSSSDELRAIVCLAFTSSSSLEQVQNLEHFLIDRPEVLHAAEVEGHFDFLFEAAFPDLAHFHDFMSALSGAFGDIMRKKKFSFVCRRFIAGAERAVWVHEGGKRVRVDLDRVERVIADGDYVRLHVDGHDFLFHATMRAMEDALDPRRFIRVHRSAILRLGRIERLRREGRHWVAESRDGAKVRVAKAHVTPLLERLSTLSATYGRHSAKHEAPDETPVLSEVE